MPLNLLAGVGQYPGTLTNDNAAAGKIGEIISASVSTASPTSLSNGVQADLVSISLTAGDWDVTFLAGFMPAATTSITRLLSSISATSATYDPASGRFSDFQTAAMVPTNNGFLTQTTVDRVSVASTTTIYGVVYAAFTVSTLTAFGKLWARRAR